MGAHNSDVRSNPNQNVTWNTETNRPDSEPVSNRKHRARCVSVIICTIAALLVITFCIVNRTEVEFQRDTTQKNTTNVCYVKKEKLAFSGLFTTALSLFGVVLGTLVNRLSLINAERHHLRQRYHGSWKEMIKACFSGIVWGPVVALLGSTAMIIVVLIFVTGKPWFEVSYLVYIFSGIGVGPLIMHLLNLNTQSEVHISMILEDKGMNVANGLAWSYYFNYLRQALPTFKKATGHPFPAPHEGIKLSLNKLLLLIPHDCNMTENLNELDNKIDKLFDIRNDHEPFSFSIYRLTVSEHRKKYFAIQYAKEPLEALREMSLLEKVKAVKEKSFEKEVKLLCTTLSSILKSPPDQDCRGMCMLVPIKVVNEDCFKNGGLVKCILDIVQPQHLCSTSVDGDNFVGFVNKEARKMSRCRTARKDKHSQTEALTDHKVTIPTEQVVPWERKQIDVDTRNKQDDARFDKKALKTLPKACKMRGSPNNQSKEIKQNEKRQLVQEFENENNDSGASTSGYGLEMPVIAFVSEQRDQNDEYPSSNKPDQSTKSEL